MLLKLRCFFVISAFFVFVISCSDNSKKAINDDTDADSDTIVISDTDEINDLNGTDEDVIDNDTDENIDSDSDTDSDTDTVEPVMGISGHLWVETGSSENKDVSFYECGVKSGDEQIVKTDSDGYFEVETVLESGKTYCVESGLLGSCFVASSESHVANINPMTQLAFLVQKPMEKCTGMRDTETAVRSYLKVGTGKWLGELDYEDLPGIQEGFDSIKGLKDKTETSDILADVATDLMKADNREFEELFNGFVVIPEKNEVIIENTTTPVGLNIAGGNTSTAPGFKIKWLVINDQTEGAQSEIWSDDPGEFTVRAFLYKGTSAVHIAQSTSAVIFFNIEEEGVIDVSDLSADMSYWISDGAVTVFAAGTEITKGGNTVEEIEYQLLSGGISQIAKVAFYPSGTVFTNDPMFFIVDLGSVFSGDPIMLGVERIGESGEISVMAQASGDPIMLTASGDPIMFTASGDPIMNIASGDPIMYGDMSSVLVTATNHFSDFTVKRRLIPVKTEEILDSWDSGIFLNWNPFMFISESITKYKTTNAAELTKFFVGRSTIKEIEGDVDRLFNMTVGNVKNINIFENYFYIDSMIKRFKARKVGAEVEKYASVYKGFDIKNLIYEMYQRQMSNERSVTIIDLFDNSLLPETFIKSDISKFPDMKKLASSALLKISDADLKKDLIVSKKDALDLLTAITVSGGPSFGTLTGMLTPDQVLCAWLSGRSLSSCNTTPSVFSINSAGNVAMDGTEVTETHIDVIFSTTFRALPEEMSVAKKHNLFRTLYLIINYGANLYENAPAVTLLSDAMKKMVFEMFDGMEVDQKAVKLVDSINNLSNTVSINGTSGSFEVPIFENMIDFLSRIKVIVPTELVETDVINSISIKISGYGYTRDTTVDSDLRPEYKIDSSLGTKTFTINDVDYQGFPEDESAFLYQDLAILFGEEDINVFGDCYADVSIVVISTVDGKKHVRTKSYKVNTGSIEDAQSVAGTVNTRPVTGEISVHLVNDSYQSLSVKNGGVVLMPGNLVFNNDGGANITIKDLKPAIYVVEGFADGYYSAKKTVALKEGNIESISIQLITVQTGTETGEVNISFSKRISGGSTGSLVSSDLIDVYIFDHSGSVVRQFKNHVGLNNLLVSNLKYGQYSLKVISDNFHPFLESFAVLQPSFEIFLTLETKNICGNEIVETGEECDNGYMTGNSSLKCKDLYSDAIYPDNFLYCLPSCTYNTTPCY